MLWPHHQSSSVAAIVRLDAVVRLAKPPSEGRLVVAIGLQYLQQRAKNVSVDLLADIAIRVWEQRAFRHKTNIDMDPKCNRTTSVVNVV